jgi:hypothetical protein
MMNQKLLDAFENCLQEIEKGAKIEECLLRYPDLADELRPSLEAAMIARSLSSVEVPLAAINRSRSQVLRHAARLRSEKKPKFLFMRYPSIIFSALLLALVFILGSRELAVVSAESLPGDRLYSIKRVVEDLRVQFAPNQEIQFVMEAQYREQRIEEVNQIIDRGWARAVSFEGIVNQLAPTRWIVGDIEVVLTMDTKTLGDIRLGSLVEVEGITTSEGWVEAQELHLREFEFIGQVESIDNDSWNISGSTFKILSITQIDSSIQMGDTVLMLARSRDDGSNYAIAILQLPSQLNNTNPSLKDITALIAGKSIGDEFDIVGIVESISASEWVIDGYSVTTSLNTEVKDEINLGDYVRVKVILGENRSLIAQEIEIANGSENDEDIGENNGDGSEDDGQTDSSQENGDTESNSGSDEDRDQEDDEKQEQTAAPDVSLEPAEIPEPEDTEEPEETETPEETEQPEESDEPDVTEQPEETESPEETEQPEETEEPEETEGSAGIPGLDTVLVVTVRVIVEPGGVILIA